jgi:hypothetical protein
MTSFETIDDARWFLQAAGWSVAEARVLGAVELRWLLTARRGEAQRAEQLTAEADGQTEAYRALAELAAELVSWE